MVTSFSLSAAHRSHYYELCTIHVKKNNCIEFAHLPLQDVCRVTQELPLTVKSVRSLGQIFYQSVCVPWTAHDWSDFYYFYGVYFILNCLAHEFRYIPDSLLTGEIQ